MAQYKQHQPFNDYYTAHTVGRERVYQRIFVGIGKHLVSGGFSVQYDGHDTLGNATVVSSEQKLRASHSFVVQIGSFFPIALLGDNSTLALNTELLFSYAEFGYDSVVIHPEIVYKKRVPYVILGIPLSLDFKTGGDVSLSKGKTMFTAGAGLLPCLSTPAAVNRRTQSSPPLTAVPFMKLEAGGFAGLAFKLRAVVYLRGGINVKKTEQDIYFPPDELTVKVQSGYGYHISLIIMPFSYGWTSDKW